MSYSSFLGVTAYSNRFRAQIFRRGRVYYLGLYETADLAAKGYDRAVKLTLAYSKKRPVYNYEEPEIAEDGLTEAEKDLLSDLRMRFPGEEEAFRSEANVTEAIPNELIEHFNSLLLRSQQLFNELSATVGSMTRAMRRMASEQDESAQRLKWYQDKVLELEAKLDAERRIQRDQTGKVIMRPVTPLNPLPMAPGPVVPEPTPFQPPFEINCTQ